MKKVILLVRVSTQKQDYTEQTNQLIDFAKRDGYTDDEMIIIQDKESASKLSDEERQGLNKMYEAIDNNNIEAVYAWELSRISRRPNTLWNVYTYLEKKKINLKTQYENFKMLDEKKEVITSNQMAFSLFVGMVKGEIAQKVARVERQKEANAKEGYYNGGNRKYGYIEDTTAGKGKPYITHPEQSEIVREIFTLYSTGKYGHNKIYKELISKGKDVNIRLIENVLKSRYYTGELIEGNKEKKTYTRRYPAIISTELFDKCRDIAKQNNTNIDKSKMVYFGNKLIKCNGCGRNMRPTKHSGTYYCNHKYPTREQPSCTCKDTININALDSALWYVAKNKEINYIMNTKASELIEYKNKIEELNEKISNADTKYNILLENKCKQLKTVTGIDDEKYIHEIAAKALIPDKFNIDKEVAQYTNEIEHYKLLLKGLENNTIEDTIMGEVHTELELEKQLELHTDEAKYDLIHKHIKKVTIHPTSNFKIINIETYDSGIPTKTLSETELETINELGLKPIEVGSDTIYSNLDEEYVRNTINIVTFHYNKKTLTHICNFKDNTGIDVAITRRIKK